jgi:hypothetical protein
MQNQQQFFFALSFAGISDPLFVVNVRGWIGIYELNILSFIYLAIYINTSLILIFSLALISKN